MAHQLVEAMVGDRAGAIGRDVGAMVLAGHGAVDPHPEPDRLFGVGRAEHEMKVARAEAIDDASGLAIEHGLLFADRPLP